MKSGDIFGFVSLTDMGDGVFELNDLAVLPELRHGGYGKKLLDFCKAKVVELGGECLITRRALNKIGLPGR